MEREILRKNNQLYQILIADANFNISSLTSEFEIGTLARGKQQQELKGMEGELKKIEASYGSVYNEHKKITDDLEKNKAVNKTLL